MESIVEAINLTNSSLALLLTIISTYIVFRSALLFRKKHLRDDYQFLQLLLEKYTTNSDMLPLQLEAGFLAYIGEPLRTHEIKLLLSPKYQMMGILGIKHYTNARKLLDVSNGGFSYKDKKIISRNIKYSFKWSGYLIWSALTYFPMYYLVNIYQIAAVEGVIKAISLSVVSGIMTYFYLKDLSRFSSAKIILKEARKEQECVKDITYPMTEEIKET